MAVYVDEAAILYKGKPRHHLTADTLSELHAFAQSVGIKRCWYHSSSRYPHYDITDPQRAAAIAAGAQAVDTRVVLAVAKQLQAAKTRPAAPVTRTSAAAQTSEQTHGDLFQQDLST